MKDPRASKSLTEGVNFVQSLSFKCGYDWFADIKGGEQRPWNEEDWCLCLYSRFVTEHRSVRLAGYKGIGSDEILQWGWKGWGIFPFWILHLPSFLFTSDGAKGDEKRKSLQIIEIPASFGPNRQYQIWPVFNYGLVFFSGSKQHTECWPGISPDYKLPFIYNEILNRGLKWLHESDLEEKYMFSISKVHYNSSWILFMWWNQIGLKRYYSTQ